MPAVLFAVPLDSIQIKFQYLGGEARDPYRAPSTPVRTRGRLLNFPHLSPECTPPLLFPHAAGICSKHTLSHSASPYLRARYVFDRTDRWRGGGCGGATPSAHTGGSFSSGTRFLLILNFFHSSLLAHFFTAIEICCYTRDEIYSRRRRIQTWRNGVAFCAWKSLSARS